MAQQTAERAASEPPSITTAFPARLHSAVLAKPPYLAFRLRWGFKGLSIAAHFCFIPLPHEIQDSIARAPSLFRWLRGRRKNCRHPQGHHPQLLEIR